MISKKLDNALHRLPVLDMFSSKKMVSLTPLNHLGAQPFRIWLSSLLYNVRPGRLEKPVACYIETLKRDGVVAIPDFLPRDQFQNLKTECEDALKELKREVFRHDGPNLYTNIDCRSLKAYPNISSVFDHPDIQSLFRAAEKRNMSLKNCTRLLECLEQGEDNGQPDPETSLHEDTFFNTHKAWLYLEDVNEENGPFVFVKGSHKHQTVKRYRGMYRYSLGKGNAHSRRISPEELQALGLNETTFTAKKNTLVLANTLGFHRRRRGKPGFKRTSLAFSARFNPFM